jgi:hypothetical protein
MRAKELVLVEMIKPCPCTAHCDIVNAISASRLGCTVMTKARHFIYYQLSDSRVRPLRLTVLTACLYALGHKSWARQSMP